MVPRLAVLKDEENCCARCRQLGSCVDGLLKKCSYWVVVALPAESW